MALVKKQVSSRRFLILVTFLAAALGAGIWYVFLGTPAAPTQTVADPTQRSIEAARAQLREVEAGIAADALQLSDDARFQELRQFGDYPVSIGATGRPNPFQEL